MGPGSPGVPESPPGETQELNFPEDPSPRAPGNLNPPVRPHANFADGPPSDQREREGDIARERERGRKKKRERVTAREQERARVTKEDG